VAGGAGLTPRQGDRLVWARTSSPQNTFTSGLSLSTASARRY
jgi:hypothetical protein